MSIPERDGETLSDERIADIRACMRRGAVLWSTDIIALCHDLLSARAECARLRAELELERRKDHAHNSWTNGYEAAMADYVAGRTAQWPARAAVSAPQDRRDDQREVS